MSCQVAVLSTCLHSECRALLEHTRARARALMHIHWHRQRSVNHRQVGEAMAEGLPQKQHKMSETAASQPFAIVWNISYLGVLLRQRMCRPTGTWLGNMRLTRISVATVVSDVSSFKKVSVTLLPLAPHIPSEKGACKT